MLALHVAFHVTFTFSLQNTGVIDIVPNADVLELNVPVMTILGSTNESVCPVTAGSGCVILIIIGLKDSQPGMSNHVSRYEIALFARVNSKFLL